MYNAETALYKIKKMKKKTAKKVGGNNFLDWIWDKTTVGGI